jgi:putative spermidine/putrescine transport system ATP-binding protein
MGTHNVISGRVAAASDGKVELSSDGGGAFVVAAQGPAPNEPIDIAVRADRIGIGESRVPGYGFTGLVSTVEFLGSSVKLVVTGPGIDEFTVFLDEEAFLQRPVAVGNAVPLNWADQGVIALGRPH